MSDWSDGRLGRRPIGEAVAFIDRGATVTDVAEMPHLHPTLGEILGRVAVDLTA